MTDPETIQVLLEAARRANWDAQHGPTHLRTGRFNMTTAENECDTTKPVDLELAVEEQGDLGLQITLSSGERWRLSIPRTTIDAALAGPVPSPCRWDWKGHAIVLKASARIRSLFERGRFRCKYDTWARLDRPAMDRDNVWTCECKLCTGARLMHRTAGPPPQSPEDAEKVRIRLEALLWKKPSADAADGVALQQANPDPGSQGE